MSGLVKTNVLFKNNVLCFFLNMFLMLQILNSTIKKTYLKHIKNINECLKYVKTYFKTYFLPTLLNVIICAY